MITRKIAKNGMRGRKKVSLLLTLVLTFTFIFITTAVLLETSMKETRIHQREQLYGTWHAAYLGVGEEEQTAFLAEPDVTETVTSELLGKDKSLGTVGTISQSMVDMGNLVITQGRLPESPGEIVIEESVADALGITKLSENTLTLNLETILVSEDKQAYMMEQAQNLYTGSDDQEDVYMAAYRRQIAEKERCSDDLLLSINSEYSILDGTTFITPEEIEENGLLYEQTLILTKEYKVTGILRSFSGFWDTGAFAVPQLFVNQADADELTGAVKSNTLQDLSDFSFDVNIFARSDTLGENLYDELEQTYVTSEEREAGNSRTIAFRRNTYAYPDSGQEVEETLMLLVILVIFIVTFCAILQIFLTQMKQRARKIALLKSIGTTNSQVCGILFWEGIYLLLYSLPTGVILGFGAGYGVIQVMNRVMGMELSFYVKPALIALGVLAGGLALFAGMLIPVFKALRVPLVGAISVSNGKKRKKSVREQLGKKAESGQNSLTYEKITRSHHRLNWRNRFLTSVITCISCILVFVSLYLGYQSFTTYNETVLDSNRPNYELAALHGFERTSLKSLEEQLKKLNSGAEMTVYHQLKEVYMTYDNLDKSPLLSSYKNLLPEGNYQEYIGTKPTMEEEMLLGINPKEYEFLEGTIMSTMYFVDTSDEVFDTMLKMVDEGSVNETDFIQGTGVIVAIPMYRQTKKPAKGEEKKLPETVNENNVFSYVLENLGGYELSYDKTMEQYYQKDESIQLGDTLTLYKKMEAVSEASVPHYDEFKTRVEGIIYYTNEDAIYPFLSENSGITVIGSNSFSGIISSRSMDNPVRAGVDFNANEEQFSYLLSQCPTAYGETHINIYTDDRANAVEPAAQIARLGKEYGLTFSNYNEENWNIYYRALNNALILGILGGTSLLIALMILWNIHMSAFEQERKRIGILQALGVTNHKIAATYLKTGIMNAFISLVITQVLLFGIIYAMQRGVLYLKYYPWGAHGAICMIYFLLMILVYCGPIRELRKYAPTENIAA